MDSARCVWCEGPSHNGSCDREALKNVIRVLRMEADAHKKLEGPGVIFVQSLVSHRTQKPRIDIQFGEIHTQMSADAAMDVAKNIIECCEGAYADAFLFHFMAEKVKVPREVLGNMLQEFRSYREQLAEEFKREQREDGRP